MMRRILTWAILVLFAPALALAQQQPYIPAGGTGGGGSGTVTTVSVATANGFSGTVANASTTPAITIIAGNITPSSVAATTSVAAGTAVLSGANGGSAGALGLFGSSSGEFVLQAPVAEGSVTALTPTVGGVLAASVTSPLTIGAATGTVGCGTCGVTGSPLSQFASTTSSQLAGIISDETGSGSLVFGTAPAISSPALSGTSTGTYTLGGTPSIAATALTGTTLPSNVVTTSITSTGTLTGGATGAGFTVALATSTVSGNLPFANAPLHLATGSSTGNTMTGNFEIFVCTAACTVTPPVPVAGYQFCVMNSDNVSGAITLGALGSSAFYENQARTAYGTSGTGTLVSGGAVADQVCLVGLDSTHYLTVSAVGTWTAS